MPVEQGGSPDAGSFLRWKIEGEQRAARERAFHALPFRQRWAIRLGEVPVVGSLLRAVGIDVKRP